jgi:hypothetical protein
MRFHAAWAAVTALGGLAIGCSSYDGSTAGPDPVDVRSSFKVVQGSGDIAPFLAQFRTLLGDPLNGGQAGQQSAGRREINWDGVPAAVTNVNTFPALFFQGRGASYGGPGTGFRVSDNDFADLDPAYARQFAPFSGAKTFMPTGSPEMELRFTVAGSTTPAAVTGFGVVVSDVDRQGSASITMFDVAGRSLGRFRAPIRSDAAGLSFIGVAFDSAIVARVLITAGQAAIDAGLADVTDGGNRDLVVTDDFLYGEPQALR